MPFLLSLFLSFSIRLFDSFVSSNLIYVISGQCVVRLKAGNLIPGRQCSRSQLTLPKWDSQKNLSLRKLGNSTWHLLAAVAAAANNTPGGCHQTQFWRHQMSCMFLMASLLKYKISAQWILILYLYSIIKRISFSFPKIVCWFSIFDIFLLLLHILFSAIFVPVFFGSVCLLFIYYFV